MSLGLLGEQPIGGKISSTGSIVQYIILYWHDILQMSSVIFEYDNSNFTSIFFSVAKQRGGDIDEGQIKINEDKLFRHTLFQNLQSFLRIIE